MNEERRSGDSASSRSGSENDGVSEPERVAEEWAEKAFRWVLGLGARAKEEAEDIWAEAQELRRKR